MEPRTNLNKASISRRKERRQMKVLQVTSPIHPGHSLLMTYIFIEEVYGRICSEIFEIEWCGVYAMIL